MTKTVTPSSRGSHEGQAAGLPGRGASGVQRTVVKKSGNSAEFTQDEVIKLIMAKMRRVKERQKIFDSHWLDVEEVYRAEGWIAVR